MTKERLQSISLEELETLARKQGCDFTGATDRAALTELILENFKELEREREEENNLAIRVEESKYQITERQTSDGADAYPIEKRYNQTRVVFMVRDPNWAYAYWDLDNNLLEKLKKNADGDQLVLRVHDVELIDFTGSNAKSSFDIPIQIDDTSWYIYLPNQNCSYILELGIISEGKYRCLAGSNPIKTPRNGFSDNLPSVDQDLTLNLLSGFDTFEGIGSSRAIPQRILAVPRE
jgi:hypothetical protein